MILIGLTGRTGSGKSSAARFFAEKGACVVDCDRVAHSVLEEKEVKDKLRKYFPADIFDSGGRVVRKKLGMIVFSDADKLLLLNSIVHPVIIEKTLEIIYNSEKNVGVIDGSELQSSGIDEKCRHIIVIEANTDVCIKRITARDGIDKEEALLRINAQKDYSKPAIRIENNGNTEELFKKLDIIYAKIMEEEDV